MNDEKYNQIISDSWSDYSKQVIANNLHLIPATDLPNTQEEFIEKIKTDDEFASQWSLKIEERELSEKERMNTLIQNEQRLIYEEVQSFKNVRKKKIKDCLDELNVPTKIITITYKDERIEIYE